MGPQRGNRQAPWRARGPRHFFGKLENPCKMFFWQGLGGNGPAQRPPGYHTIQSPRTNPPQTTWGTISSTKSCFPGPCFCPKKVPSPAGTHIQVLGSQNGSRGRTYQSCVLKNHAECSGRYPKRSHMLQVMAENQIWSGGQLGIPHGDSP